ncbi:hypothetical protein MPH_09027 [Macrophomina phaseolina MS6]|uniref:Uncharacterized protein n=1 Tax=Macrophomina phaseolina (strain MS6) TaxID=1126212 RepID=K2RGT9_MACPH|nr:hypothetical protein MPH_09027 [Macrophomina phaseolina MS6]
MNHTPRNTIASNTTIINPSTRTRSTSAELFYEDGAPPPSNSSLSGINTTPSRPRRAAEPLLPAATHDADPAVEHIHLLEGREVTSNEQNSATSTHRRRRPRNGPFPTNDDRYEYDEEDEDADANNDQRGAKDASSLSSSSHDRSVPGSPCWWNLPDPPFWGPENPSVLTAATDNAASFATTSKTTTTTTTTTTTLRAARDEARAGAGAGPLSAPAAPTVAPLFATGGVGAAAAGASPSTKSPVARKPLRVDTSFGGIGLGEARPVQTASSFGSGGAKSETGTRPPATRASRFSWEAAAAEEEEEQEERRQQQWGLGGSGGKKKKKKKMMKAPPPVALPDTAAVGKPRMEGALGGREAAQFGSGPGITQPPPETFIPARSVVQMATKGNTKYLQIVTDQSPGDNQSLVNQSMTEPSLNMSKSNEMLSIKRRSASLPNKLNPLGTEQFDTWLSTLGKLQPGSPDFLLLPDTQPSPVNNDAASPEPRAPLPIGNPSTSSDAQSSSTTTAVEKMGGGSVRLVKTDDDRDVSAPPSAAPSSDVKTAAAQVDAKAALFSNPPSNLPTPTAMPAAVAAAASTAIAASGSDEAGRREAGLLENSGAVGAQPPPPPIPPREDARRQLPSQLKRSSLREKTSSERLAGQGINVRRLQQQQQQQQQQQESALYPAALAPPPPPMKAGSSSAYEDPDNGEAAAGHIRVDSLMTDGTANGGSVSSSSVSRSGSGSVSAASSSEEREEVREGAVRATRRGREEKIRARKLRDLQSRKESGGAAAASTRSERQQQHQLHHHRPRHHQQGIDAIVATSVAEEKEGEQEGSGTTPQLKRKKKDEHVRPASLALLPESAAAVDGGSTTYTPREGQMSLTPVVTVAEQMPVPRGRAVKKPARLVLREHNAPSFSSSNHHRRRSSTSFSGLDGRARPAAVRTSLSAPAALASRDDLELVVGGVLRQQTRASQRDASESRERGDRRLSTRSSSSARRASSLKFVPGREEQLRELRVHLYQHHPGLQSRENGSHLNSSSSTHPPNRESIVRDSIATSTSSNGFSYYFPHQHHAREHRASSSTLQTPSAMSVVSSLLLLPGGQQPSGSNPRISFGSNGTAGTLLSSRSTGSAGGGKQQTNPLLEARVEELERQNTLLEAALQAVLKTSGMLNRCPCSSTSSAAAAKSEGGTTAAGGEESALDVYLGTRVDVGGVAEGE